MSAETPNEITDKPARPPAALFALGHGELPPEFTALGATWHYRKGFKHDFFAATALYERLSASADSPPDLPRWAVLKIQRTFPFHGLPMRWLGARVTRHEAAVYQALQGVAGIPRFLGNVGPNGFLHEFIPGTDLRADLPLTAAFFDQLKKLLSDLHQRHIAYVDCNKRENILHGDDGHPWLIDFQISFQVKNGAQGHFLAQWMFRRLVRADWYHFYKHKTRLLPAACGPEDFAQAKRRGFLHRLHRLLARPLIVLRRKWLARYDLRNSRWE
jgi:hypothetical protein